MWQPMCAILVVLRYGGTVNYSLILTVCQKRPFDITRHVLLQIRIFSEFDATRLETWVAPNIQRPAQTCACF